MTERNLTTKTQSRGFNNRDIFSLRDHFMAGELGVSASRRFSLVDGFPGLRPFSARFLKKI
jgi:hypothetical protein